MKDKYQYKVVNNGNSIEVYKYEDNAKLFFEGDSSKPGKRKSVGRNNKVGIQIKGTLDAETGEILQKKADKSMSLEEKLKKGIITAEEYRVRKLKSVHNSSTRKKTEVRRLIETNLKAWGYPVFLTLTYRDNVLDRQKAMDDYKKFIQRICYRYGVKAGKNPKHRWLKYVAVMEHQTERGKKNGDEGCLHFHTVLFNFPYIHATEIAEIWRYGGVHIRKVKKDTVEEYRKVIGYMCKYMTKTFYDDEETEKTGKLVASRNQKSYMNSQGLLQPDEYYFTKNEVDKLNDLLKDYYPGYETHFENEFTGQVDYIHYYKADKKKK